MKRWIIQFKNGTEITVTGHTTTIVSVVDQTKGAVVLRDREGRDVIVNPTEVVFIRERQSA